MGMYLQYSASEKTSSSKNILHYQKNISSGTFWKKDVLVWQSCLYAKLIAAGKISYPKEWIPTAAPLRQNFPITKKS